MTRPSIDGQTFMVFLMGAITPFGFGLGVTTILYYACSCMKQRGIMAHTNIV